MLKKEEEEEEEEEEERGMKLTSVLHHKYEMSNATLFYHSNSIYGAAVN